MTSLEWFINELMTPIREYIKTNKIYADFDSAKSNLATSSANADTTADALTNDALSATTAAAGTTASSSASSPRVIGNRAASPSTELGMVNSLWVGVESMLFTNTSLKSSKVSEANAFVSAVDKIMAETLVVDKEQIKLRLAKLKNTVKAEMTNIQHVLKILKNESGGYDALLRVFAESLETMQQDKLLDALCISLRMEGALVPTKVASNLKSAYEQPPEQIKELVLFLMTKVMQLQIDVARHNCTPKYERLLPEVETLQITDKMLYSIEYIDLICVRILAQPARADILIMPLGDLLYSAMDIYSGMGGGLSMRSLLPSVIKSEINPFLSETISQLGVMNTRAVQERNAREKQKLENSLKM